MALVPAVLGQSVPQLLVAPDRLQDVGRRLGLAGRLAEKGPRNSDKVTDGLDLKPGEPALPLQSISLFKDAEFIRGQTSAHFLSLATSEPPVLITCGVWASL